MKCPKCESDLNMMVDITIQAPSSYYGNLSKTSLRHSDVQLLYADWSDMLLTCPDCGWFFSKSLAEWLKKGEEGSDE